MYVYEMSTRADYNTMNAEDLGALTRSEARQTFANVLNNPDDQPTRAYKAVKILIRNFPELARSRVYGTDHLDLPLFAFATKRIGSTWKQHMKLLELIYKAYPEAIYSLSSRGALPLHVACRSENIHPRVVKFFIRKYPEAASVKDHELDLQPLAFYISLGSTKNDIVEALVQANPSIIEFVYGFGMDGPEEGPLIPPLFMAYATHAKHSIVKALIPSDPSSKCFKAELSFGYFDSIITMKRAKFLAKRISGWIEELQLDTRFFSVSGLAAFLSQLAVNKPITLDTVDLFVASNHFEHVEIRRALSKLLRNAPNIKSIRIRKPVDGSGPLDDDALLSSLAKGLKNSASLRDIGLSMVRGLTYEGLASIFSRCSSLESIGLFRVSFTPEGVASFAQGISECQSLMDAIIDSCIMPTGGMNQILDALSRVPTLGILTTNFNDEEDISSLSELKKLKKLHILSNLQETYVYQWGPVLELLASSTNLEILDVSRLHLPIDRLCEILKTNRVLLHIGIHYHIELDIMAGSIAKVLRDSNGTLLSVQVDGYGFLSREVDTQLHYYTALNMAGRAKVMQQGPNALSELVTILVKLSQIQETESSDGYVSCMLRYGILREHPSLWCGEYNDDAPEDVELWA